PSLELRLRAALMVEFQRADSSGPIPVSAKPRFPLSGGRLNVQGGSPIVGTQRPAFNSRQVAESVGRSRNHFERCTKKTNKILPFCANAIAMARAMKTLPTVP